MSGRRRTISKEETGVSPTSSEQSSLMSAVSSLPPHPWDAGLLNRRGPLEKLSRALIFPCVLLPLAIVRMVLMLCIAVFMFVSLLCFRGPAQSLLDPALNVCGRGLLFVFGVWPGCLRISGEPQLDKVPVAVVAPHLGMLDGFYFLYKGVPRPMALEPYAKIPLIGFLFRRIHGIAVPLPAAKKEKPGGGKPPAGADVPLALVSEPASAAAANGSNSTTASNGGSGKSGSAATQAVRMAIQEHKQRWSKDGRTRPAGKPVVILPEGTTHNGHALLRFFSGAFEGGCPVQPIVLSYPHSRSHPAFFDSTLGAHLFSLLSSPWTRMHVKYLPVHHPTAEEAADPDLFAENVRQAMAEAARLPLSKYGARELRRELKEHSLRAAGKGK